MKSKDTPSHLMNNFDTEHKSLIYSYKKYDPQSVKSNDSSVVNICTEAIDLDGMQKEAFISSSRQSSGWRLPTDESLHLRGADAAPQPLINQLTFIPNKELWSQCRRPTVNYGSHRGIASLISSMNCLRA